MTETTIKPLLGIPLERTGTVNGETFAAFLRIARQGWDIVNVPHGRIDITRNKMAQALIETDRTHLIMLDADHIHPPDVCQKLLRWAMTDRDKYAIVGGLNFRRSEPYEGMAFLRNEAGRYYTYEEWPEGLHKVAVVGTGCICIDRRVFEQLKPPWFYYTYPERDTDDRSFLYPTEDTVFSQACEAAGIAQWVDTTLTSPHMTYRYIDNQTGVEWRLHNGHKGAHEN